MFEGDIAADYEETQSSKSKQCDNGIAGCDSGISCLFIYISTYEAVKRQNAID